MSCTAFPIFVYTQFPGHAHLLRDSVVQSTVADVRVKPLYGLRVLDALRQVDNVLEVLALHLLPHGKIKGTKTVAPLRLRHLDTDVTVPAGSHSVQDGTEEGIPEWVRTHKWEGHQ